MHIDIKARKIEPIRHTYSHVARRIGEGKTATRYQEAVFDLQPTENFHYRPTWQPDKELYDVTRTAIVMEDWYKFLDPRQYYYGNYVIARAAQQDSADKNFKFVEKRGLLALMPEEQRKKIKDYIIPLRHYEWGANMNNYQICSVGYGASITSAASLHGSDRLGNAQYITRIALALSENDTGILDDVKTDWLENKDWQGVRKLVEDSLVVEDWFELFVAQNLVMDGMVHELFFVVFEDEINKAGGSSYSLLTEFITNWKIETKRWVDKQISVACAESEENKKLVTAWFSAWLSETEKALAPLANGAVAGGADALDQVKQTLLARAKKCGIDI